VDQVAEVVILELHLQLYVVQQVTHLQQVQHKDSLVALVADLAIVVEVEVEQLQ
tara:strand:- start:326 stop:487 length:162 start_codon:yes stop_codon:yes gene_type:complete